MDPPLPPPCLTDRVPPVGAFRRHLTSSTPRLLTVLSLLLAFIAGCASSNSAAGRTSQSPTTRPLTQIEIQSTLMGLSDELIFATADACNRVERRATGPDARVACAAKRLNTAVGAIAAATSENATVGFVDFLTLVTLLRGSMEEPWAGRTFDDEDRLLLRDAYAAVERRAWDCAGRILTPRQQDELRELIRAWRAEHPDQATVTFVSLQDFATDLQAPASGRRTSGSPLPSVLGLLGIDPMANLTPATRQIQETRLFAERMSFWAQRLPMILGWQVELTAAHLFASDPVRQVLANASQFTAATTQFSGATDRVATSYDRMLGEIPGERRAAIEQLDRVATTQASALVDRTATVLTAERTAAIDQLGRQLADNIDRLNRAVDAQREQSIDQTARLLAVERQQISAELTAHLAAVDAASQRLVDRAATRLFLVIAFGALAVACIAYVYRRLTVRLARPAKP